MTRVAGTRVGPYQVVALVGEGGMGHVYRAHDTMLGRDAALKLLPPALASDADRVARFHREARTLAALNHPHIAQIFGVESANGVTALAMEFVAGEDLASRVRRGALPVDEVLAIGRQVADALDAAHTAGIVHRDLKPANIVVRADGVVKVLDFGLAKALDAEPASEATQAPTITTPAMTHAGVILGTAAYMSPEQARGKPIDKRTDIWAFGCVLYELLTGRRAFDGETVTDVLSAIVRVEPDWTRLPAATPLGVRVLLDQMLKKDVKHRLRDIGDLPALLLAAPGSVRGPIRCEHACGIGRFLRPSSLLPSWLSARSWGESPVRRRWQSNRPWRGWRSTFRATYRSRTAEASISRSPEMAGVSPFWRIQLTAGRSSFATWRRRRSAPSAAPRAPMTRSSHGTAAPSASSLGAAHR